MFYRKLYSKRCLEPKIRQSVKWEVAQINEKFQLHRILTKFGVLVLMKAIKFCKFQLDRDAALGVQAVSKNPLVHFIIQFPL
jgi:hypothetical protein